jgi:vanillate O-demethylase monooxygenase subunit
MDQKYLRNAWYAASWDDELGDTPVPVTILDEPLVLYRNEAGAPVCLSDTCPHRFAPLHMGRVVGDAIACPYHGLQFGPDGRCVLNPHGPIAGAAHVQSFALAERYGMLWAWLGDQPADPATLPVIPELELPGLAWVHSAIDVHAEYRLMIDNLMDLSHVEFLHPMLGTPGSAARVVYESRTEPTEVRSIYHLNDEPVPMVMRMLWPTAPDRIRIANTMTWRPPAMLSLGIAVTTTDGSLEEPVLRMPSVHFLTPAGDGETRYFFAAGRNVQTDSKEADAAALAAVKAAFQREDEPMVAAVQARMAKLAPEKRAMRVAFKTDAGAVQAQRTLERMIAVQ